MSTNDTTTLTLNGPPQRPKGPHAPLPTGQAPATPAPAEANQSEQLQFAEEDPRTRAARRAAELIEHGALDTNNTDKFYIDPAIIPDGWTYEYRAYSVLGKVDDSYVVTLAQMGWEAVPAKRHPELMPRGYSGNTILRDGLMLMERPTEIVQESRKRDAMAARQQMGDKEAQLAGTPQGQAPRDNKGDSMVKIKKSYAPLAPLAIPKE